MSSFFKHPEAIVESKHVGDGTRVWAFAHILRGATVGRDCNICDHVFIENEVRVGDRVTVKCGVQLWDGIRVEDDVFIGPNATFANDPMPRSRQYLEEYPETIIRQGASIGANATVLPGVTIGQHAMVGAGAVVTNTVPPFAVVVGNPARLQRYVSTADSHGPSVSADEVAADAAVKVSGVELLKVPLIHDLRGNLIAREIGNGLPFTPVRCFFVFDVPTEKVRGEHAHRRCAQFLICLSGSVVVLCDDGRNRQEFLLSDRTQALHLPPMVWSTQYKYTRDAMLFVLASRIYEPEDYIREYDQFLAERQAHDEAEGGSIAAADR